MPNKSARKIGLKRSSGWKSVQSQKQTRKTTKLALIALAAIVSILILAKIVKFTNLVFHPWNDSAVKRTYSWKGKFNINLVIKAKNISLVSFNPQMSKITLINIPDQTYIEGSHGFGKWQISSIYGLGESQKGLGGGKLLKDTTRSLLGVPIDGYLSFSEKYAQMDAKDIISEMRGSPFAILGIMRYLKADLTPLELIKVNMGISSVRFDKVKEVDLENLSDPDKLLDGTEILIPDIVKIDSVVSELTDEIIKNEHQTIAIFNSTDKPGLAQKAARIITNMGGDVIITNNSQTKLAKTQIIGSKSKTLDRIKQIFNPSDIIDPRLNDLASSRAQINIFLGEDYIE